MGAGQASASTVTASANFAVEFGSLLYPLKRGKTKSVQHNAQLAPSDFNPRQRLFFHTRPKEILLRAV